MAGLQQAAEAAQAEADAARTEAEEAGARRDELYAQIGAFKQHVDEVSEVLDGTEAARAAAAQEAAQLRCPCLRPGCLAGALVCAASMELCGPCGRLVPTTGPGTTSSAVQAVLLPCRADPAHAWCREALEEAQAASALDLDQLQHAQAQAVAAQQQATEAGGQVEAAQEQLAEAQARAAQAEQDLGALQQQVRPSCQLGILLGRPCRH